MSGKAGARIAEPIAEPIDGSIDGSIDGAIGARAGARIGARMYERIDVPSDAPIDARSDAPAAPGLPRGVPAASNEPVILQGQVIYLMYDPAGFALWWNLRHVFCRCVVQHLESARTGEHIAVSGAWCPLASGQFEVREVLLGRPARWPP
jgi:hypothetical protein